MPALLIAGSVILSLVVLAVVGLIFVGANVAAREKAAAEVKRQAEIQAVTSVKQQDELLNSTMKSDIQGVKPSTDADLDGVANRINTYVAEARKIDTSVCPRDYAEAYSRYLSAWSEEAAAVRVHPHVPSEGEAFVEGFFRGLGGDPTGGAVQRQDEFKSWLNDVKAKDAETQKQGDAAQALAVRYGA